MVRIVAEGRVSGPFSAQFEPSTVWLAIFRLFVDLVEDLVLCSRPNIRVSPSNAVSMHCYRYASPWSVSVFGWVVGIQSGADCPELGLSPS